MKTLIVATDYSRASTNALAYAANMARHMQAQLILAHAYYMTVTHLDVPVELPGEKELQAEHMQKLQPLADQVSSTYGVKVICMTGPMPVTVFMEKLVNQTRADLVVMGMKELSTLDQRIFGSTAASVISAAKFPVLIVPDNTAYTPISRIMIALDDQVNIHDNVAILANLAQIYKARVQVLRVVKEGKHEEDKLPQQKFMETVFQSSQLEFIGIHSKDITQGIKQAVSQYTPNLLIMFPHKHDFWDVAFNKSQTRRQAFQTNIPLLALPEVARKEREYRMD